MSDYNVNQAKTRQLIVMEIILNACNHKHLSNNLDSFYETSRLFSDTFFGPIISAAVNGLL